MAVSSVCHTDNGYTSLKILTLQQTIMNRHIQQWKPHILQSYKVFGNLHILIEGNNFCHNLYWGPDLDFLLSVQTSYCKATGSSSL